MSDDEQNEPPTPPRPSARATRAKGPLDRRLDALSLPIRITRWAARRNVQTLADVVRWHPSELRTEKNFGRTSIGKLREVIRDACGVEWEALWRESDAGVSARPADIDWDALRSCLPEALLETPLDALGLPARMLRYARRRGLETVGDLVQVPLAELVHTKKLGEQSIDSTLALILEHAGSELSLPPDVAKNEWDALGAALPPWLMSTPLEDLTLPARMHGLARREGLETVADLVAIPRMTLTPKRNLGRRSLAQTCEILLERAAHPPRRAEDAESLWALWLEKIAELAPVDRMVLTQRAGIHGEPRTLAEVGAALGFSRERARQIESRAVRTLARGHWVAESCARLERALEGSARVLDELGEADPWLAVSEEQREAFAYFLRRLAGGELALGTLDGRAVIARCASSEIDASLARARATLEALPCPAGDAVVREALLSVVPPSAPGLAPLIAEALEERIHRDADGRMVAFGTTREAEVLAFLRRCPAPVPMHELFALVGRLANLPDEVFHFGRREVGVEQHFPDYAMWKRHLVPICVRIMEEDPRQWRMRELLEAIREELPLPEWLDHWSLGEILRRSPEVRYLGRLRVTLPGVHDEERVNFAELAQRVLLEHGEPLSIDELWERVTRETTLPRMSLRLIVIRAPFVEVEEARFGLLARDVPGGAEAIARFGDALEAELARSGRGLHLPALAALLRELSEVHARWTLPMARGVARADPRFQLSRAGGGAVGLAAWEDVRVPTRRAVIRACIDEHGGRAPIRAVLAELYAHHGVRLGRGKLGTMVHGAGARVDGEELVYIEPSEEPEASVALPALAEESRALFEALLERPLEGDIALLEALDAHVEMIARAAKEGGPVDAAEAARLRERCRALLARGSELGPRARRLAHAAARYVLRHDEAGVSAEDLDDDAAVLGAVERHLAASRAADSAGTD